MNVLSASQWKLHRENCLNRLQPVVRAHLDRASSHQKHPVMDFLFQYYSFRPSQLMAWSPGIGVVLEDDEDISSLPDWMVRTEKGWQVNVGDFPDQRRAGLAWVIQLLEAIQERPPRFGCYGLHEWAMVYKAREKQIRHGGFPLRLPMAEIEEVVNTQPLHCTHYDAFRFFMPGAKPLNRFQPLQSSRVELEQSGCIHVNMDHYKWAYKYYPWVSTRQITEAFELAVDARSVDMRASPYDLRELGYEPIPIETPEGREEYQAEQKRLQKSGIGIRASLLQTLKHLLQSAAAGV